MNKLTGQIFISGTAQSDTNIRYLSGFTAPDPFLFMKFTEGGCLIVSPMEKGRAQKEAKPGTEVFTPSELSLSRARRNDYFWQIHALMDLKGLKRLEVPGDFPAGIFSQLQKKKIPVSILSKPACPERKIKGTTEIAALRASQRAAVSAMQAAIDLIASSTISENGALLTEGKVLTAEQVRRTIHIKLIEHDSIGMETIVAGGNQATDPHNRGCGPLYAGEAIIIDIFPKSEKSGYWGDITRTVCRGKAKPELRKLYNAVKAAQAAALRTVKPQICADDVHQAAKSVFEQRGYKTEVVDGHHVGFIHGTGHGVGLDIHELPRVGTSGEILETGNVITVEPGLYYPGLGGVRIEDTIVVTKKGWRYLASCGKHFELL